MSSHPLAAEDLPLSRTAIDRDGEARLAPGFLSDVLREAGTRVLLVHAGRVPVAGGRLVLTATDALPEALPVAVYLGRTLEDAADGVPAGTAVVAAPHDGSAVADAAWAALREVAAELDARDAALATTAIAALNWHENAGFCPRCGAPTSARHAGWMRHCAACGAEHFPRTDPAVIVRILDADDRILLGSNALWEANRYSLIAGFVEAGESLEAAVLREVAEEAGVRVADPLYLGSQPWPFPRSLMLGFEARLAPDQAPEALEPDGEEILDVRWFTREELRDPESGVILPGSSSIAHAVIEQWLDEGR